MWPDLSADFYEKADEARQIQIQQFLLDFESLIHELHSYETYITLSILCAIMKLFEYYNKSKAMNALIGVLEYAKDDLKNLLLIFFCILLGFMMLAHLSFGTYILEFSDWT
jgi:hypothetical protein